MNILRQSHGWIRKAHQCSGCERNFKPPGVKMHYQRIANSDGLYTVWTCETCEALTKFLEPEDGEWMRGFVANELSHDQTPEQLLEYFRECQP